MFLDHGRLLPGVTCIDWSQHALLELHALIQLVLLVARLCGENAGGPRANRLDWLKSEVR